MKTWHLLLSLILVISLSSLAAHAHDIGVSQAELKEQENNRYLLRVQAGTAVAHFFLAPLLPERCEFTGNPRGTQGGGWKTFEFICDIGLTAEDVIELPWRRDGVVLNVSWFDGSEAKQLIRNEAGLITVALAELQAGSGSWFNAARRYTVLGIEHILIGIDHLLFVLGLLLIVKGGWMLVKTITAFTIAHSITLGLATLGLVNFPSRPVEAAIALSIVFLAIEILHAKQGRVGLTHRFPWVVAFAFGLLHGLGFAGALSAIGLPQSEIPIALLFFNIGVEIGQLMFVVAVLLVRWPFMRFKIHRFNWAGQIPAYAIGTVATYWLLERVGAMVVPA